MCVRQKRLPRILAFQVSACLQPLAQNLNGWVDTGDGEKQQMQQERLHHNP